MSASRKILTQAHIEEVAKRYERQIQDWDVENENPAFEMPIFKLAEEPGTFWSGVTM